MKKGVQCSICDGHYIYCTSLNSLPGLPSLDSPGTSGDGHSPRSAQCQFHNIFVNSVKYFTLNFLSITLKPYLDTYIGETIRISSK